MSLMGSLRRLIAPQRDDEVAKLRATVAEQEGKIAAELHRLARTPNPHTGESDPLGALVHALQGTQQRRYGETDQ